MSSLNPIKATDLEDLAPRLQSVRRFIAQAAADAGRSPSSVKLLAVSKTFSPERIQAAHAAGQRAFGENYVQEAQSKITALASLRAELEWHFIGLIQRNKTAFIATHFDWVHTVDRLSIAERLSNQRPASLPPLNVCIQVNISREPQKNGVTPEALGSLAQAVAALPRLRLRGLMALPKPLVQKSAPLMTQPDAQNEIQEVQCLPYREMYRLYCSLQEQALELDTLSLGTSADFKAAVLEGSTMVRVGSAIFGNRAN